MRGRRLRRIIAQTAVGILCWMAGGAVYAQSLSKTLLDEGIPSLASAAREKGDAVRGAILFSQQELGCVKCHQGGATDRLGPDLARLGRDATDPYIVESLLAPSQVIKKGYEAVKILTVDGEVIVARVLDEDPIRIEVRDNSDGSRKRSLPRSSIEQIVSSEVSTMPADLMDKLADRQQFLDLSKYLMDLAAATPAEEVPTSAGGGEVSDRLQGLALIDHYRCTACHAGATGNVVPRQSAPDLTDVTGRIDSRFLHRFLEDPAPDQTGDLHARPARRLRRSRARNRDPIDRRLPTFAKQRRI